MGKSLLVFLMAAIVLTFSVLIAGPLGLALGAIALTLLFVSSSGHDRPHPHPSKQAPPTPFILISHTQTPSPSPPTFSHSRISRFTQCPKAYELEYIQKRDPEFDYSIEAWLGKTVHAVVAHIITHADTSPSTAQALFDSEWHSSAPWLRHHRTPSINSQDIYVAEGRLMVTNVLPWLQAHVAASAPWLVEQRLTADLVPGHSYTGIIDALLLHPASTPSVIDFKTGRKLPSFFSDQQLPSYAWLVNKTYPAANAVHVRRFNLRSMSEESRRLSHSELNVVEKTLRDRIAHISQTHSFPPRPSPLCNWCRFQQQCIQERSKNA